MSEIKENYPLNGLYDSLMDVYTLQVFQARLRDEIALTRRHGREFSLLLIDIDNFESIYQKFGTFRGNEVLSEFAKRVRGTIRSGDLPFRFGEDEMVILLPWTEKSQAIILAERLLNNIASIPFSGKPPLSCSVSIGIASFPTDAPNLEELTETLIHRTHRANRIGTGCIVSEESHDAEIKQPVQDLLTIEQTLAKDVLQSFLSSHLSFGRSVLRIVGPVNCGQSRFLGEARRNIHTQNFAILAIDGNAGLQNRIFGALLQACRDWDKLPNPLVGMEHWGAVLKTLIIEKEQAGLLLVLDHLQYIDQSTLKLIEDLYFYSDLPRVCIVYTCNDEDPHIDFLSSVLNKVEIRLEPLSLASVENWLKYQLHDDALPALSQWLYTETGGLPDLLTQGLDYLSRLGYLKKVSDKWEWSGDIPGKKLTDELAHESSPHHHLPSRLVEFIGREEEILALKDRLHDERLITLLGLGGIGKTSLALQIASESLDRFPGGVFWVHLIDINSTNHLVYAIGNALNISFAGESNPKRHLLNSLRLIKQDFLLVLDGFGVHLDGSFLAEMLDVAHRMVCLVTSRVRLGLTEESIYTILGLEVPDSEDERLLERYSSVQLFLRQSKRKYPNLTFSKDDYLAIARICRLLNGIPLGIELATAWLGTFSCQQIAAEIEHNLAFLTDNQPGLPYPTKSFMAVLESCWNLFSESERQTLNGLAVFSGGFCNDAARYVADASPFFLEALVAKSFLRKNIVNGKYELPEVLRQYAIEYVANKPEINVQARDKHCTYFSGFLEERSQHFSKQKQALDDVSAELDNVLNAWNWGVERVRISELHRSLTGLSQYFELTNLFQEGETILEKAVVGFQASLETNKTELLEAKSLLCRLLVEHAHFLNALSQFSRAINTAQSVVDLANVVCLPLEKATGYLEWGIALEGQGNFLDAREQLNLALSHARSSRFRQLEPDILYHLGVISRFIESSDSARQCLEQALKIYQELDNRPGEGKALINFAYLLLEHGEYLSAKKYIEQALQLFREIGQKQGESSSLHNLGLVYYRQGEYELAKNCYEQALQICHQIGDLSLESQAWSNLGTLAMTQGKLLAALDDYESAMKICREIGDQRSEGVILINVGCIALYQGNYPMAQSIFEQVIDLSKQNGNRLNECWGLIYSSLCYFYLDKNDVALDYIHQALQATQFFGGSRLQAYALTNQGHILSKMNCLDEASHSYQKSLELRLQLSESKLALEPLAGLARIALLQGNLRKAQGQVKQILADLDELNINSTDDPLWIYLTCYQVLSASQATQAEAILVSAHDLLLKRVEQISDQVDQSAYLHNIPVNRALIDAWNRLTDIKDHLSEKIKQPAVIPLAEISPVVEAASYKEDRDLLPHNELFSQTGLVIRALGPFELSYQGRNLDIAPCSYAHSLLALLLLHHGRLLERSYLVGQLWPDCSEADARRRLSNTLYHLRKRFPPGRLQIDGTRLGLSLSERDSCDLIELMNLFKLGSTLSPESLLSISRGLLFPELEQDWVVIERETLRLRFIEQLEYLALMSQQQNEFPIAVALFQRLMSLEPFHEAGARALMQCLHTLGRTSEAIDLYEQLAKTLSEELNITPSPETEEVYHAILRQNTQASHQRTNILPRDFPLVGRDAERRQFLTWLVEPSRDSNSGVERRISVALLEGEAGVGKSHLLTALADDARWRDWQVAIVTPLATSIQGNIWEHALSQFLNPLRMEHISLYLEEGWLGSAARFFPQMRHVFERIHDEPFIGDAYYRAQIHDTISHILAAATIQKPLLLILDDMHLATYEEMALFSAIVTTPLPDLGEKGKPLVIVISYRASEMREKDQCWKVIQQLDLMVAAKRVTLAPLTITDVDYLIRQILGPMTSDTLNSFYEITSGYPLYIREALAVFIERGVLIRQAEGNWRLDKTQLDTIPWSGLESVILGRVARLPVVEVEMLAFSVLHDGELTPTMLEKLCGIPVEVVLNNAKHLLDARFWKEGSLGYYCSHEQIRNAIVGAMELSNYRRRHCSLFQLLQDNGASALITSRHALEGGLWETAISLLNQAAGEVLSRGGYRLAAELISKATEALQYCHLNSEEIQIWKVRLLLTRQQIYSCLGLTNERATDLNTLDMILPKDSYERLEWMQARADWLYVRHNHHGANNLAEEALGILTTHSISEMHNNEERKNRLSMRLHLIIGRTEKKQDIAVEHLEIAKNLAEVNHDTETLAAAIHSLGLSAYKCGNFSIARHQFEQAHKIAKNHSDNVQVVNALSNLGVVETALGNEIEAINYFERAISTSEQYGILNAPNLYCLASTYLWIGCFDQADELLQRSLSLWLESGDSLGAATARLTQGLLDLERLQYDSAHIILRETGRLFFDNDAGDLNGIAHLLLGLLYLEKGAFKLARESLIQATITFENQGIYINHAMIKAIQANVDIRMGNLSVGYETLVCALASLPIATPNQRHRVHYYIGLAMEALGNDFESGAIVKAQHHFTQAYSLLQEHASRLPAEWRSRLLNMPRNRRLDWAYNRYAAERNLVRLPFSGAPTGRPLHPWEEVVVLWEVPALHPVGVDNVKTRRDCLRQLLDQVHAQEARPTDMILAKALGVSQTTISRDLRAIQSDE